MAPVALKQPLLVNDSSSEDLEAQLEKPAPQILFYHDEEDDEARSHLRSGNCLRDDQSGAHPAIPLLQDDADDTAKLQDRKTMWLSILTLVLSVPALIGA